MRRLKEIARRTLVMEGFYDLLGLQSTKHPLKKKPKMKPIHPYSVPAALALAALTAGPNLYAQDNGNGLRREVTALHAQVAALRSTVSALERKLANASHVLALDP